MRALVREQSTGREIYPESEWTEWTRNHLDWEIEINGWTLVDPYEPDE